MFKIKEGFSPKDLGFVKKDCDYVYYGEVDGLKKVVFTVYMGASYLRYSKTAYVTEEQLKLIYDWAKQDLIEWESL